jgi:hypothetical protein
MENPSQKQETINFKELKSEGYYLSRKYGKLRVKSRVIITASLITVLITAPPLFARRKPDSQDNLQRIDTNHDDQISEREWIVYQTERFKKLDANGNGFVSEKEIKQHTRSMDNAESDDDDEINRSIGVGPT